MAEHHDEGTGRPQSPDPEGGVPAEKLQADGGRRTSSNGCLVLPMCKVTTTVLGTEATTHPTGWTLPLRHEEDKELLGG